MISTYSVRTEDQQIFVFLEEKERFFGIELTNCLELQLEFGIIVVLAILPQQVR